MSTLSRAITTFYFLAISSCGGVVVAIAWLRRQPFIAQVLWFWLALEILRAAVG